MRNAIPDGISTAGACGSTTSGASRQACRSSPAARLDPYAESPSRLRRGSRICSSTFIAARQRVGDPLGEAGGDLALGHDRPVLDPVGVDEVDRVAVAAEGAGAGRHVVGEDPVAALARALGARVGDDVVGLGGKADDQAGRSLARRAIRGEDVGVLDEAQRSAGRRRPS